MFEENQVAGTPMFIVKAYLPVNESFGKNFRKNLNLFHDREVSLKKNTFSFWGLVIDVKLSRLTNWSSRIIAKISVIIYAFQVSLLIYAVTPEVKRFRSASLITGKFYRVTRSMAPRNLVRWLQRHENAKG